METVAGSGGTGFMASLFILNYFELIELIEIIVILIANTAL